MTDFKTPIVLDTGSSLMKAGFADQGLPTVIFPTIIGMPKYEVRAMGHILNVRLLVCDGHILIVEFASRQSFQSDTLTFQEIMNGNFEGETYIGHEAQHMRGVLALKHPIKNGIIRNWDEMERVSRNAFV